MNKSDLALEAAAGAVAALCRFSGPPAADNGVALLLTLAGDSMPPATRARARRELANLAKSDRKP
jgi:hypothetical protein